ncbi:MAG: hypothetical protein AAF333_19375 [Planctomycetota bacterium]
MGFWVVWRAEIGYCDDEISLELFDLAEQDLDVDEAAKLGFQPDSVVYLRHNDDLIFYYLVWRHGEDETYLAWMYMESDTGEETIEVMIISELSTQPNLSLATASQKQNHEIPLPPGDYVQTFSSIDLPESWRRHRESEAYLINRFGITDRPAHSNALDLIERSIRQGSRHILRRPWLLLIVPYRYWIGKHLRHDKSIVTLGV